MLTNEEKINLRERAYRLANELVAHLTDVEGITREADVIYQFLSKDLDDDPLKLGTPGPVWRHESDMSPEEYWRLHSKMQGIDWSRPQLVKSKNGRCIVEVNTKFSEIEKLGEFSGKLISGFSYLRTIGCDYTWSRKAFEYHGEIPQEQQEGSKTTGMTFLEAARICKEGGKNIRRPSFGPYPTYLYSSDGHLYWQDGEEAQLNEIEDILATDWQIIEP